MRKVIFLFTLCFCVFARGGEGAIKLGDVCETQEDCEDIGNALCNTDDTCECKEHYISSANDTSCLPLATKVGDGCEIEEQCSAIPSAECVDHTCTVAQALTTQPPIISKGECTEDSQCSSFFVKRVCKNGTCVMSIPPISPKTIGLDIVLGNPCELDTECSGEGVVCAEKLCKCTENFVPAQNLKKCLPKAKAVGDDCVETAQCSALDGAICENKKCSDVLTKAMTEMMEKIPRLPHASIGSSCQADNECKHLTNAACIENVCQCTQDYVTSITSDGCLEKAKKEGDPCKIDKQCEDIKGATCLKNKCVKPGVIGAKLGKQNSGSKQAVSKLILGAILFIKMVFV